MLDDLFVLSRNFLKTHNRPFKRYFFDRFPLQNRLSIIIGPRGVGKTTVIIQHLLSEFDNDLFTRKGLYIPADHFVLGKRSVYEIAEEFQNLGGAYMLQ
jgi:predicted AAA+ superfamily ATPase